MGNNMNNRFALAIDRFNSRLQGLSPITIWLLGACDATVTIGIVFYVWGSAK